MMMRVGLMVAATVAAIPGIASAQQTAPADKPVTKSELSATLDADYADLDANKDGKVTSPEINARLLKSGQAQLEVVKKERDAAFGKFDTDGNGSISRAEFDARAKLPTVREPDAKPFLDRFDANKDGVISKTEFRAPPIANFDKLDKNKDGTVSVVEMKAAPAASKEPVKQTPPMGR